MKNTSKSGSSASGSFSTSFAAIAIPLLIISAYLIFLFVLGEPTNFQGDNPENHPKEGNFLGIVYKGGIAVVPLLISQFLIVLAFGVERFITISRATGRGSIKTFVRRVQDFVAGGNVSQAIDACDKQRGSIANVVRAGLIRFSALGNDHSLEPDKKILLIQKDIEETTQLEMPMLEKNLVILSTIASIATLLGLLGTVFGMIRAFAAMATAGAPDAVGLANGISEALINTALGIATSALAIIFYNYFTNKIDTMTFAIDEASYSIVQNFTIKEKGH